MASRSMNFVVHPFRVSCRVALFLSPISMSHPQVFEPKLGVACAYHTGHWGCPHTVSPIPALRERHDHRPPAEGITVFARCPPASAAPSVGPRQVDRRERGASGGTVDVALCSVLDPEAGPAVGPTCAADLDEGIAIALGCSPAS